jgi:hypothetical protein
VNNYVKAVDQEGNILAMWLLCDYDPFQTGELWQNVQTFFSPDMFTISSWKPIEGVFTFLVGKDRE